MKLDERLETHILGFRRYLNHESVGFERAYWMRKTIVESLPWFASKDCVTADAYEGIPASQCLLAQKIKLRLLDRHIEQLKRGG